MAVAYWVGNGGNFNDPLHWASSSGGTGGTFGGAGYPFATDDVRLDGNSFSLAGQHIRGNQATWSVNSFNSSAVTNAPYFDTTIQVAQNSVDVTGLSFVYSIIGLTGTGTGTITTGGTVVGQITLNSGTWSLLDDLAAYNTLGSAGLSITGTTTFTTNNHNITGTVQILSPNVTLGTSVITINQSSDTLPGGFYLFAGGTSANQPNVTINSLVGGWIFLASGGATIGTVRVAGDARIGSQISANTINNLTIDPGTQLYITSNSTSKLTLGTLTANGTPANPITLTRASASYITAPSGTLTVTQGRMTNINVSGGATWNAVNSVDNGGNSGWNWLGNYDPIKHPGTPTHIH